MKETYFQTFEVGEMLGTEFDETLGKVAIPGVMNIKVRIFR